MLDPPKRPSTGARLRASTRVYKGSSFSKPNRRSDFDQSRSRLAVIYLAILLALRYQEIAEDDSHFVSAARY